MKRKILFVLFAGDECRQAHAFWYALGLHAQGHDTRLILEGPATQLLLDLDRPASDLRPLLARVQAEGILVGSCHTASIGCGCTDATSPAVQSANAHAVPLLVDMAGHAAIAPFVNDGYEIVVI